MSFCPEMNELMADNESDMSMFEVCTSDHCLGKQSVKRSSDSGQSLDMKRICDEDMSSQPLIYNYNDVRLIDKEEEEEEYREFTEEEQNIMYLSNQLINFNINICPLVWDEYYVEPPKEKSPPKPKPVVDFPPKVSQVIHGYFLQTLLSATKRTAVYLGYKVKTPEDWVVIKIGFEMGFHKLENEYNIYKQLKTSESVPKFLDKLWWKTYNDMYSSIQWGLIVLEKCGPNLVDLMKTSAVGVIASMEDVYNIAIRLIDAIEDFHSRGWVHLSLKPKHILLSEDKQLLKLIGLYDSKTYLKESVNGKEEHIENQKDRRLPRGDPNFHSIGYHNGFCRSRRDDMESLGYCLIYLVKGTLPWIDSSVINLSSAKVIRKIGHRMQNTPLIELCDGLSPAFRQYFDIIAKYEFTQKPDYEELRKCFRVSPQ